MKTFLFTILFFLSAPIFAQMNEQRTISESHIDFSREAIGFTIHGLIEIDGHTFYNDTCKNPIQFQANLDGIAIVDTASKTEYTHRVCSIKGCPIVHLTKKQSVIYTVPQNTAPPNIWWNGTVTPAENLKVLTYPSSGIKVISDTLRN